MTLTIGRQKRQARNRSGIGLLLMGAQAVANLTELPYKELHDELMRRHLCLCARPQRCDFCNAPLDSEPPCRHPERHYVYGVKVRGSGAAGCVT